MATVTGMTVEGINAELDKMVVSYRVDASGKLIYKTRAGNETDAGAVIASAPALEKAWPIGSIFTATVSSNPSSLIGIGTWVRFGNGRVLVSQSTDTDFDAAEETGGSKTATLSMANIPTHTHSIPTHNHSIPAHTHTLDDHTHGLEASYNANTDAAATGGGVRMTGFGFGLDNTNDRTGTSLPGGAGTTGSGGAGTTGSYAGGTTGGAGSASPTPVSVVQPYIVVYMWKRTA